MSRRAQSSFKKCRYTVVLLAISMFFLSILLIKTRQMMILYGREISSLEKSIAFYDTKISALNAEIIKLVSTDDLMPKISRENLVKLNKSKIVKISVVETNLYAMHRSNRSSETRFVMNNKSKQHNTNLPQ